MRMPQPAWAVILAFMGMILAIVVLYTPTDVTSKQAAFTIASSLVTGALGAFAGRAEGTSTTQSGPNATVNQQQPPPQP